MRQAFVSVAKHTNRGQMTKNRDPKVGHRAVFVARGTNLTVVMAGEVLSSDDFLDPGFQAAARCS